MFSIPGYDAWKTATPWDSFAENIQSDEFSAGYEEHSERSYAPEEEWTEVPATVASLWLWGFISDEEVEAVDGWDECEEELWSNRSLPIIQKAA